MNPASQTLKVHPRNRTDIKGLITQLQRSWDQVVLIQRDLAQRKDDSALSKRLDKVARQITELMEQLKRELEQ